MSSVVAIRHQTYAALRLFRVSLPEVMQLTPEGLANRIDDSRITSVMSNDPAIAQAADYQVWSRNVSGVYDPNLPSSMYQPTAIRC